ncbi:MAG: Gfo/Idh/MocA family protein [Planctomycetota bacterium]
MSVRLGLIGIRHMGANHYGNLLTLVERGEVELVALCDTDEWSRRVPEPVGTLEEIRFRLEHAERGAGSPHLPLVHMWMQRVCDPPATMYDDYRKLLDHPGLDGVIICTPNVLHEQMVCDALARDLPVLCEKPLGATVEQCDAMMEAERTSKGFIQVGLHMRYRQLSQTVHDLVASGRLGTMTKMYCQEYRGDWNPAATKLSRGDEPPTNWRYLQWASGGSIVEKLCHDFDIFTWWSGLAPLRVTASGGKAAFTDRETIDHAEIMVDYSGDATLAVSLCMFSPNQPFRGRHMGLVGTDAMLVLHYSDRGFAVHDYDGHTERFENVEGQTTAGRHAGNASLIQTEAFIRCITSGEPVHADSSVGRLSVAVAQAAETSIAEGRPVELAELGVSSG